MDRHGAEKSTGVERWSLLAKKTLQFLATVSFFSFFHSYYFSGFSSYNLHFSTFIFSLLAHAMDRKYMILICNVILAFLVKNLTFNTAEDGVKQITETPAALLLPENVEYGTVSPVAGEEETEQQQLECSCRDVEEEEVEVEVEVEEEEELQENKGGQGTATVEEVSDASVSTEELNRKIEEFIKKMKEEIRIEAQQQPLITV